MLQCSMLHKPVERFAVVQRNEPDGFSQLEHEWRTSVTAIRAAAEILRDHDTLPTFERDRFVEAIIEESGRLTSTFESFSEFR
jgi:hypothetical protein